MAAALVLPQPNCHCHALFLPLKTWKLERDAYAVDSEDNNDDTACSLRERESTTHPVYRDSQHGEYGVPVLLNAIILSHTDGLGSAHVYRPRLLPPKI